MYSDCSGLFYNLCTMDDFNTFRDTVHVFLLTLCAIISSCHHLTLIWPNFPLSICHSPLAPVVIVMDATINLHPHFPALKRHLRQYAVEFFHHLSRPSAEARTALCNSRTFPITSMKMFSMHSYPHPCVPTKGSDFPDHNRA